MYKKIPVLVCLNKLSLQASIEAKLSKVIGLAYFDFLPLLRLSQCKNYSTVAYRTAIALAIASKTGSNSGEIAYKLIDLFFDFFPEKAPNLAINVSVLSSGIIEFSMENIDIWLDLLANNLIKNIQAIEIKEVESNEIFFIKYTLKRCYSLLILGQEHGLISLENFELRLGQEFNIYEQKLINEFVTFIDNWNEEKNISKLGINLSNIFWQFERYCRIFGEIKRQNLALAQRRLSLVYLTYLLLQFC
jgi:arginyl-tRNA synthetase